MLKKLNSFRVQWDFITSRKFDQSETENKFYFLSIDGAHGSLFRNHPYFLSNKDWLI